MTVVMTYILKGSEGDLVCMCVCELACTHVYAPAVCMHVYAPAVCMPACIESNMM